MGPPNPPTKVETPTKLEKPEISCSKWILKFIIKVATLVYGLICFVVGIGNLILSFWLGPFLFDQLLEFGVTSGLSPDNLLFSSFWNVFSAILALFLALLSYFVILFVMMFIPGLCVHMENIRNAQKLEEETQKAVSCKCDHDKKSCPECEAKLAKAGDVETGDLKDDLKDADDVENGDLGATATEPPPTYGDCLEKNQLPDYTAVMAAQV